MNLLYAGADALEKLDSQVTSAITEWLNTQDIHPLQHVTDRWQHEMHRMVECIDGISDPAVFVDVTGLYAIISKISSKL